MSAGAAHWIDGARRGARDAGTYEHSSAWRGSASKTRYPCASAEDWSDAFEAAERSLRALAFAPPSIRSASFERLAAELAARRQSFAEAIAGDLGWSAIEAEEEVDLALRACAEALRGHGREHASAMPLGGRRPGVLLARAPGDAPLAPLLRALGGALWAGNAWIAAAANEAPSVSVPLVDALERSALHAGCAQVIFGREAAFDEVLRARAGDQALRARAETVVVETWTRWSPVDELAEIESCPASGLRRLGEDRPAIAAAFGPDVDPFASAERFAERLLARGGFGAETPRALFVHEDLASELCDALVEVLRREPAELPLAPLVEPGAVRQAELFVRRALEEGVAIPVGGQADVRGDRRGNAWYEPTLLVNVPSESQTAHARVRAPIAVFGRFRSLDDLVARLDLARFHRLWAGADLAIELRALAIAECAPAVACGGFGGSERLATDGLFDVDSLRALP